MKYTTGTLMEHALSWWTAFAQEKGLENAFNLSWYDFKKEMVKKYYSHSDLRNLDTEFYHLVVKGTDLAAYMRCFQELKVFCAHMVPDNENLLKKFIGGLPPSIEGM